MPDHVLTLASVFDDGNVFWLVGGAIAVIGIITSAAVRISREAFRERSRREIAAYIAEGSMTPEQGERLMASGRPDDKHD
jgi:hypothetical protein